MLQDSARLQLMDVAYVNKDRKSMGKTPFEPLYQPEDVDKLMKQFQPLDYETAREIVPGVTITFHDAGHLLGSALTEIRATENGSSHVILFTGDLGRKGMPILRDPVAVSGADTLITESTYGNRVHDSKEHISDHLQRLMTEIGQRRSKLIIPAFSVGRTQQLLYFLDELYADKKVPDMPVYVDSPLSTHASEIYDRHPECYDEDALARLKTSKSPFTFSSVRYITDAEKSKTLNDMRGPIVIIAPSGMCEGGRILHHLKHNIESPANIILFVGYQGEDTLGRYIVEGQKNVTILGAPCQVRARIETVEALSGHADANELEDYFKATTADTKRAFIVHGELDGAEALSAKLTELGIPHVEVPEQGEGVTL
jgi:metallo-beta-lactamase family protein